MHIWESLFAEEDLSRQIILQGFIKLNSPCKNLHLNKSDLTYFVAMSHFSLLGPRTSRSHHEADSTADRGKKKFKWRIRKIFTNETMIILYVLCCAKSLQLCLTLCDPMNPPPGSSVPGILQSRILEWAAVPFSRGASQPRDWTRISYVSCISRQVLYH